MGLEDNESVIDLDAVRAIDEAIKMKEAEIELVKAEKMKESKRAGMMSKLLAQLAVLKSKRQAAAKKSAREEAAANKPEFDVEAFKEEQEGQWARFAQEFDYYYVQKGDRFCRFLPEGEFEFVMSKTMFLSHGEINEKEDLYSFAAWLQANSRTFVTATSTFDQAAVKPYELNVMRRDHWVPLDKPGDYHVLLDLVMKSLGGGKKENIEHLEKLLAWKMQHPEDYLLPVPVIFGEGEIGKGLMFEEILPTLVGKKQVAALEVDNAIGSFNGLCAGKTFVMLNEAIKDNINVEKFKARTVAKNYTVNEKYGLQYVAMTTAMLWVGGNGLTAAIALANDKSDRRWSILRVEKDKSLMKWIMEDQGFSSEQEANEWFQRERHHVCDREQVAAWIGSLIVKHSGEKYRPRALHGEDHKWLLNQQKRSWQELCEHVFNDEGFTHIHAPLLYKMYCWFHGEVQPSSRFKLKLGDFYLEVERWLSVHHPEITKQDRNVRGDKMRSKLAFYATQTTGDLTNNRSEYEVKGEYNKLLGYHVPGFTMPQ